MIKIQTNTLTAIDTVTLQVNKYRTVL